MSEWIKVVDRLPPNDGHEVLVSDGHYIGVGICKYKWSQRRAWTQEAVWYKWNLGDYGEPMKKFRPSFPIRYWMPLPEPPKEEQGCLKSSY